MKTLRIAPLLVALFMLVASSCERKANDNQEDAKEEAKDENKEKFEDTDLKDDWKFAIDAADDGMLEVELGKLAQTKAVSTEVKNLAAVMVTEHTKANDELKNLATQKNISIPATLSDKSQRKYDDLNGKSGKDFDEAYAKAMVDDHEDAVDLFKKEADKGNDPELKAWAAQKVPTLEHHLQMAKQAKDVADKND
ncbi:MAG TPA: DUF4142 domain-containing protein [Ohtaekwangia sp.]